LKSRSSASDRVNANKNYFISANSFSLLEFFNDHKSQAQSNLLAAFLKPRQETWPHNARKTIPKFRPDKPPPTQNMVQAVSGWVSPLRMISMLFFGLFDKSGVLTGADFHCDKGRLLGEGKRDTAPHNLAQRHKKEKKKRWWWDRRLLFYFLTTFTAGIRP
jgi:hypothetical protein